MDGHTSRLRFFLKYKTVKLLGNHVVLPHIFMQLHMDDTLMATWSLGVKIHCLPKSLLEIFPDQHILNPTQGGAEQIFPANQFSFYFCKYLTNLYAIFYAIIYLTKIGLKYI